MELTSDLQLGFTVPAAASILVSVLAVHTAIYVGHTLFSL